MCWDQPNHSRIIFELTQDTSHTNLPSTRVFQEMITRFLKWCTCAIPSTHTRCVRVNIHTHTHDVSERSISTVRRQQRLCCLLVCSHPARSDHSGFVRPLRPGAGWLRTRRRRTQSALSIPLLQGGSGDQAWAKNPRMGSGNPSEPGEAALLPGCLHQQFSVTDRWLKVTVSFMCGALSKLKGCFCFVCLFSPMHLDCQKINTLRIVDSHLNWDCDVSVESNISGHPKPFVGSLKG